MLSKIFNKIGGAAGKVSGKLSDIFSSSQTYTNPLYDNPQTTQPQAPQIPQGTVDPSRITSAIHHLESSGGTHPDTPRNQQRQYTIPSYNQNEQDRTIDYDIGYGGEYGLTPVGLAELAKSTPNREAPYSEYTKHGAPLVPGRAPEEIQQKLMTPEGAGELALELFYMKRQSGGDYSPEALARDYMDYYLGKGGPNYTPENYQKVLEYFKSLVQQ